MNAVPRVGVGVTQDDKVRLRCLPDVRSRLVCVGRAAAAAFSAFSVFFGRTQAASTVKFFV